MNNRIALIVDNPIRDLPGLVLVAHTLCRYGVECFLVPMNIQEREIWPLRPDFVLLNHLRHNYEPFIRRLIDANISIGVLDTEGGFYGDLHDYSRLFLQKHAILDQVQCYCAWGPRVLDFLKNEQILSPSQLKLTGLPRYDYYSSLWKNIPTSFLPSDVQEMGNVVLFNTKISVANPRFTTIEREIRTYVEIFGISLEDTLRHKHIGKEAIKETCILAKQIANDNRDIDVIIRPHPHERIETYNEQIGSPPRNLQVRQQGAVDGWILKADALIHRHCSTAIEAGLAGVPALAPQWLPTSQNAPDAEEVSVRIKSYDELAEITRAIKEGTYCTPDNIRDRMQSIIEEWLYKVDGKAHERVAQEILNIVPDRANANEAKCKLYWYNTEADLQGWSLSRGAHVTKQALHLTPSWDFRRWRRLDDATPPDGKGFTANDVQQYLEKITQAAIHNGTGTSHEFRAIWAREDGAYLHGYQGYSVLISGT